MKRDLRKSDWFRWSDGREFTRAEWQQMSYVLKRQKQPGESFRKRFERCRSVVEKYKSTTDSIIVTEPGLIARAVNWMRGKPSDIRLEVPGK